MSSVFLFCFGCSFVVLAIVLELNKRLLFCLHEGLKKLCVTASWTLFVTFIRLLNIDLCLFEDCSGAAWINFVNISFISLHQSSKCFD